MAWRLFSIAFLALATCDRPTAVQPREEQSEATETGFQLSEIANLALPRAMALLQRAADGQALTPYLVKCALPAEQRMAAGGEELPGGLGLVPEWLERPMTASERRWVSACLLALMNASGEHVEVSLTGSHGNLPSTAEEPIFREGAFYGDLFDAEPKSFTCSGDKDVQRSSARAKRVCTEPAGNGVSKCQMGHAGQCETACADGHKHGSGFGKCLGGDRRYDEVITIFLPRDRT